MHRNSLWSNRRRSLPAILILGVLSLVAPTIRGTAGLGMSSRACSAAEPARLADQARHVLKERCGKCHGGAEPKGGLELVTLDGVARGAKSGAVVVRGRPDQSRLWQVLGKNQMPPEAPLDAVEKEILRRWIADGAPELSAAPPPAIPPAFRPLASPPRPVAAPHESERSSLDVWWRRELVRHELAPQSEAARETLVRRVALDLLGLPPTPHDLATAVAEDGPDAYERYVDRLLASPRFGDRWGKHWLDAAGYSDSNGYFSADTDRPLAYRYRDYVLRSVNADKPFDRFVREQLAGDELSGFSPGRPTTPEVIELLEATHFLRNGQDGTDIGVQEPEAFEIDRRAALEAVVQVTASSLLGLTLHCARCHDHKFEPVTTREYYEFQAVFFPAFNPQDWINPKDRTVYAYLPGEKEAWEQNEQRVKRELAELRQAFVQWVAQHREPAELLFEDAFGDDGWKERWSDTAPGDDQPGGKITFGAAAADSAQVVDGALRIVAGPGEAWLSTKRSFDWTPDAKGDWIQATFDLVDNKIGGAPAERIGYVIAAHDYDDSSSRDGGNVLVDGNPTAATSLYRDYPGKDSKVIGQIGEQGYVPGRNYGVRVTNAGDDKFRVEHLVDGLPDGKSLELSAADLPDGGFAMFFCCNRSYVADNVRVERSLRDTPAARDIEQIRQAFQMRRKAYDDQRMKLEASRTAEPGRAIAWVSDKSAAPPNVPLLTRGLYHLRGPNVEPGVPRALTDSENEFRAVALPTPAAAPASISTGRRTALADWLTRPGGRPAALLARVHVNRIWRQYFGRGIVATTDNLGRSGSTASHPELLDDLAYEFVARQWSAKELHRRIVTSTAYRQSSAAAAHGLSVDPDNRFWWRFPLRRLEAEVIRDGMLAVAGELDETRFGPYVPTRQTAVGDVIVDEAATGARRRTVYLQQRRSQTPSLLKLFDAPSIATVCSSRPSSTVPLQSLALLNSEFAVRRGEAFAKRLLAETPAAATSRVVSEDEADDLATRAWRLAIGRDPTAAERALAREFLAAQTQSYSGDQARFLALADFCQMLLASNAFLYVE